MTHSQIVRARWARALRTLNASPGHMRKIEEAIRSSASSTDEYNRALESFARITEQCAIEFRALRSLHKETKQ